MKTVRSESFFKRAQAVMPGGVHSPLRSFSNVGGTPRFIDHAKGPYLWDVDGNQYVDCCMGWGSLLFGHVDPEVASSIDTMMSQGWCYGTCERRALELAELVTEHIPWVEKVRFVNSGTEAVMSVLRLARAATGRNKILKFEGGYHGHVDPMLIKAGSGLASTRNHNSAGLAPSQVQETIIVPMDDVTAFDKALSEHDHGIAAIILEPLPTNYGVLVQDYDFLRYVEASARKNGILLIFDEVVTGFRVAFGGMSELLNIQPDLVVYGCALGGGLPMGAFGGKSTIMDLLAPEGLVYQAGSLVANPLVMASGIATLQKLLSTCPYGELTRMAQKLADDMTHVYERSFGEKPFAIRHYASLFWMTPCVKEIRAIGDMPESQEAFFKQVFHGLLNRGVYLSPNAYAPAFMSTAHTDMVLESILEAWEGLCREMAGE